MRRNSIVIALALLLMGALVASADEAVLIDFSLLKADIVPDPMNQGQFLYNRATMMDFSGTAGASFTADQKKQMRTSLAIDSWDVVLASSSRTLMNQELSMTREAPVSPNAPLNAGKTVMGIRVHFPTESYNSWAMIEPPFEIPAFEPKADIADDGTITPKADQGTDGFSRFEGSIDPTTKIQTAYGIVKNVGVLKAVAVDVKGLNYPHGLSVVLIDENGNKHTMFMGYLNFDGWKQLRWDNPQYVSDVRNRDLRIFPLYPKSIPFVKFGGFLITRDAASPGGDFITYVRDVKILYDEAVLATQNDIQDEAVWGIVGKKEAERKLIESKQFGNTSVLRYMEQLKEDTINHFTNTMSSGGASAAAPAAPAAGATTGTTTTGTTGTHP
ncbi:MAG: flagellar filament outer layer protein FlaA [Treponema sp.]|nr:flagellar filament outer layer protein FlaA [Treponema sp.]